MALHIPDIRAIRLFVPFVIHSADFITNFTNGRMTRILTGYFSVSTNIRSSRSTGYRERRADGYQAHGLRWSQAIADMRFI
jgi:hypothetical protein